MKLSPSLQRLYTIHPTLFINIFLCHIAGNFRGVLNFIIFVVPRVPLPRAIPCAVVGEIGKKSDEKWTAHRGKALYLSSTTGDKG